MAKGDRNIQGVVGAYLEGRLELPSKAIAQYAGILKSDIERALSVEPESAALTRLKEKTDRIVKSNRDFAEALEKLGEIDTTGDDNEDAVRLVWSDIRNALNALQLNGEFIRRNAEGRSGYRKILSDVELIITEAERAFKVTNILNEPTAKSNKTLDLYYAFRRGWNYIDRDQDESIGGGRILIIDSDPTMRALIAQWVRRFGCEHLQEADSGALGLQYLQRARWDLVLLDLLLDDMTGFEILNDLAERKDDTPVIMVTSVRDQDFLVDCIRMGAQDFLDKPPSSTLLKARIRSAIERKRLKDQGDDLLHSILPKDIARRWIGGQRSIADSYEHVGILFTDLCGFTQLSANRPAEHVIVILNDVFEAIDQLISEHGVEKIKTIGDAYMIASGLPGKVADARSALLPLAELALHLPVAINKAAEFVLPGGLQMRIGLHVGPAVAGVIGHRKIAYDVWGETVNLASRMESHSEPGRIHVTKEVRDALAGDFLFDERDPIDIKGIGSMQTYFLTGRP